jgi:hypothetical protein
VWLAGQRVGVVDGIDFLPPSTDTTQRLLLTLHVLQQVRPMIRRGAEIGVHAGGNLIGAPVVTIALSRPAQPPVLDDDTLHAPAETDVDRARAQLEDATTEAPLILADVRLLGAQLRAARGTLGAFGIDGGVAKVSRTEATAARLVARARSPHGIIGRLTTADGATRYAREALARADSVRELVTAPPTALSLGRFRRDRTLFAEIDSVRSELDLVAKRLAESAGTAGRLQHDSALAEEVARARAELAALLADLKHHPLRYLAF